MEYLLNAAKRIAALRLKNAVHYQEAAKVCFEAANESEGLNKTKIIMQEAAAYYARCARESMGMYGS